MALDITNINAGRLNPQAQNANSEASERNSSERGRAEARNSESGDRVEISRDAKTVDALQRRIAEDQGFDQKRVERITRAIAEGSYPVDQERIAAKFIELEGQLRG